MLVNCAVLDQDKEVCIMLFSYKLPLLILSVADQSCNS